MEHSNGTCLRRANSAAKLSGWDNEVSEPERAFVVPAKCEAATRNEKTRGIVTPTHGGAPNYIQGLTPASSPLTVNGNLKQSLVLLLEPSILAGG